MNNQQIAILQSIEAVLRAGSDTSEMRVQLDAIFALLSPIERQILLNYEFAPVAVISPMYLAVQLGLQEVLAWLVQYGASPDGPDRLDQPLLLSAIEEGYFDSAQALLKLGADSHALTKNGSNSVMLALGQGNQSLAEQLCGVGVSLKHVNHDGLTALHFAAMSGNLLLVQWVQAQTALTLNVETRDGRHALHFCRSYTLFKWLQGADPDADLGQVFSDGDQALHYFCLNGQLDIVRDLLDFGIDANVLGCAKNSALHYAVSSGSVALVQLLIARGAKVEARNKAGMRPLHWAAELGDIAMLEVLLSHRAKVKIKGNSNGTILQTHSPLYLAVQAGHFDAAQRLLQAGAEVNDLNDTTCRTALCAACDRDDLAMVDLLLENGASANGVDAENDRFMAFPLASAGSVEVVHRLIAAGADVNAAGRYGATALHDLAKQTPDLLLSQTVAAMPGTSGPYCIRTRHQKRLAAIATLLEAGASPFARDQGGEQPHEKTDGKAAIALLKAAQARLIEVFDAQLQLPILLAPIATQIDAAFANNPLPSRRMTLVYLVSSKLSYTDVLILQQSIEGRFGPVVEFQLVQEPPELSESFWRVKT